MKIVFATNNAHKLSEIRSILGESIEVLSLKDIGCNVDIPETGMTLEENALQKANYIYDNYHIDCFADDTGLEVDALGGAPGIYSARYASMESNDNTISHDSEANMARLLRELGDNDNRRARFRTVIALIQKRDVCPCGCTSIKEIHQFEGIVEGQIIRERRGGEGFGYDPVFQPDGYDKTFAELGMDIKNNISHRARAVARLAEFFRTLLLLFAILCPLFAFPQVGTWRNYLAYHEVQDIRKAGDYLFVLASNGLYQYNLNDQSICTYDRTNGLSDTHITHIAWSQQARRLIAVYENSNIDLVDINGSVTNIAALYNKSTTEDKTVTDVRIDGIYAWLVTGFAILKVNLQRAEISETYTPNHPDYPASLPEKTTADYDNYISLVSTLKPIGPDYNHFYEAKFLNGRLYTTGGYFISGIPDPVYPGIIQVYDGSWNTFEENIGDKTGYRYIDINCLDVMPGNPQYVIAGGRTGMYEFINGALIRYHNQDNSPLRGAVDRGKMLSNNYVLISTMKFDSNGHLWVLNNQTEGVTLLEFDPSENKWTDHHNKVLTNDNGIGKHAFRSMFFDSRGLLWFVNDNWVQPAVFCCDTENDIVVKYDNFVNQDGTRYNINWITCVCEDKEGNIWVGTDVGPFMIQKSEVGESSVTFYQVKVPRNDGSNLADYLLSGVSISSIAVDGGNRKWFGSDNAGAFLISADNMQQIHSFNTANSRLISDNIASIAINPTSGEVFFLSDRGLCSYMGDATEASQTMDDTSVYAYPNPVTPDYTGLITITGLSYDADVKITSSNGALIAQGRSNGGMFTWDGCDSSGRRVSAGVYFVITATGSGNKGTVCKIAVIN